MKKFKSLVADLSLKSLGVLIQNGVLHDRTAQKVFNLIYPLYYESRTPIMQLMREPKTVYNNPTNSF